MFSLPEKITIWTKLSNNGFGGVTWSEPFVRAARTSDKVTEFKDANGKISVANKLIYSKSPEMVLGAMILVGESSAVAPSADAREIMMISAVQVGTNLRKAWL